MCLPQRPRALRLRAPCVSHGLARGFAESVWREPPFLGAPLAALALVKREQSGDRHRQQERRTHTSKVPQARRTEARKVHHNSRRREEWSSLPPLRLAPLLSLPSVRHE
jgi:hypothetical protein